MVTHDRHTKVDQMRWPAYLRGMQKSHAHALFGRATTAIAAVLRETSCLVPTARPLFDRWKCPCLNRRQLRHVASRRRKLRFCLSPFSLFAPVKSCLSSVGSGEDQAVNAVSQFYLMEIDQQPKGGHSAISCSSGVVLCGWAGSSQRPLLPQVRSFPQAYRNAVAPLA